MDEAALVENAEKVGSELHGAGDVFRLGGRFYSGRWSEGRRER
jgi:hypothetical protein